MFIFKDKKDFSEATEIICIKDVFMMIDSRHVFSAGNKYKVVDRYRDQDLSNSSWFHEHFEIV